MEFNGINLILILLAPVAVITVIVLFIYPLQSRLFDREKPLKKEIRDKRAEFKKDVKQKVKDLKETTTEQGLPPSDEQLQEFRGELKALQKEYTAFTWDKTKEIIKVHNEESGFSDTVKELRADVGNPGLFYIIGSILFTPIVLPISLGLSVFFIPQSAGHGTCLFLLLLPVVGSWFGYKSYISQHKKAALFLCLPLNIVYTILILYGIMRLG